MDEMPRQSEILKPWVDERWFTETDRERGLAVHRAINGYIRGLYVPSLISIHQGYFNSFGKWAYSMIKDTAYAEGWINDAFGQTVAFPLWRWHGPLVSKLGFTGTPDFIGLLTGDEGISVVDWKTSLSIQKAWQLQVSGAYRICAEDNGFAVKRCLTLRLDKEGGQAKVTEYGDRMDIAFFCKHLDCWRFWKSK